MIVLVTDSECGLTVLLQGPRRNHCLGIYGWAGQPDRNDLTVPTLRGLCLLERCRVNRIHALLHTLNLDICRCICSGNCSNSASSSFSSGIIYRFGSTNFSSCNSGITVVVLVITVAADILVLERLCCHSTHQYASRSTS